MDNLAEDTYENVPVPRRVKISSKRQITIPVDVYERHGFTEYALLSETPSGFSIEPLSLVDEDEELTVKLLRHLIEQGLEGEELLEKYSEIKPKLSSYASAVRRSQKDIVEGRVKDFDEVQESLRGKHGL